MPSEIGPYPSGAPAGTVSLSMSATTKAFDTSVTSDTGDLELASTNPATTFSPIVINPGQPHHEEQPDCADELIGLPYTYTIK